MGLRRNPFVNEEFYHIFNRGVDKRAIFINQPDIQRFFQSMNEFNTLNPIGSIFENSFRKKSPLGSLASKSKRPSKRLVDFICFCLNENHYHFILKQVSDQGIEKFMHRLSTGYTKYFNLKHKRTGVLFQGPFKSVHIGENEQLLHTSVYVNLNFKIHQLGSFASKLSSWDEYTGKTKNSFCQKYDILGQFKSKDDYKKYALNKLPDILRRKEMLRELEG